MRHFTEKHNLFYLHLLNIFREKRTICTLIEFCDFGTPKLMVFIELKMVGGEGDGGDEG